MYVTVFECVGDCLGMQVTGFVCVGNCLGTQVTGFVCIELLKLLQGDPMKVVLKDLQVASPPLSHKKCLLRRFAKVDSRTNPSTYRLYQ